MQGPEGTQAACWGSLTRHRPRAAPVQVTDMSIDLRGRGITDFEVVIFTDLMKKNRSVRSADLRENPEISEEKLEALLQVRQGKR